jgi:hypothetical protein
LAQKVLVQLIDDLDDTPVEDGETVTFALDGVIHEIDLHPENASKLRDSRAGFVAGARRTSGRAKRRAATTTRRVVAEARTKEQTKAIRNRASSNGHELADRGLIPASIIGAFEQAHR